VGPYCIFYLLFLASCTPKVIWEECIATPTSENALSHGTANASCSLYSVQCVTKPYGRYGTLWERYKGVTETYGSVVHRYGTLRRECSDASFRAHQGFCHEAYRSDKIGTVSFCNRSSGML